MGIQQSMVWVTFFMKALFVRPVYHSELHQMVRAVFFSDTKTNSLPVVVTNLGHDWDFLELIYLDGHNSKEIKRKSTLLLHGFSSQVSTSLFSSTCYV
jgi:hypothetical protein